MVYWVLITLFVICGILVLYTKNTGIFLLSLITVLTIFQLGLTEVLLFELLPTTAQTALTSQEASRQQVAKYLLLSIQTILFASYFVSFINSLVVSGKITIKLDD